MNQNITSSTKQKIKELTLHHFRLCDGIGDNFVVLTDIFSKKESSVMSKPNQIGFEINQNNELDTMSKPNQIGFEIHSETKYLEFLIKKNLITNNHKITALGLTVILSHKLNISIFSVFILSRLYYCQTTTRNDMFLPYPTLERWFESFPSVNHIRINISKMKQKRILDNNLRYRLARINIDKLNDLKKYDTHLLAISQYVDNTSEKIDNLISADPQIIIHRNKNLKLFAKSGISFA